jgi:hypothetical protein
MNLKLKHVLIGCGVAAGVLMLLGVASSVGFYLWLNQPGTLLQPDALMGPETTGFVAYTVKTDDAGARHLFFRLMDKLQQQQSAHSPFPPWMAGWMQNYQKSIQARKVNAILPLAAVWSIRPATDPDADLQLVTLSLPRIQNRLVIINMVVGFMFRRSATTKPESYHGATIYTIAPSTERSFTFFIRGSEISLASNVETARLAIDRLAAERLEDGSTKAAGDGLTSLYARTPPSKALRGALVNSGGQIVRSLRRLTGDDRDFDTMAERWSAMKGLAISGGFEGTTTFSGTLEALGPDASWSEVNAEAIASDCETILGLAHIEASVEATRDGPWVQVDVRIDDPASQLEPLLDFERIAPRKRRGSSIHSR